MDPADSLGPYRDAAEAFPDLAAPGAAPEVGGRSDTESMQRLAKVGAFPSKYRGIQQLRQTNLSTTWTAFDIERQAKVVIKEPAARMLLDDEAAERFRQEVQIAAKLSHPNIVPILATELSEPPWFFTMPFVDGLDLDHHCHDRSFCLQERLQLFLKVCDAVSYAHEQGVIHRDLKPNNILVSEAGEPQLLDFGLGRFINAESLETEVPSRFIAGTPRYMAPEQAAGFPGNTRTDVYALGSILYELATGQAPIELTPGGHTELIKAIQETTPPPPIARCPSLPTEINAIILRAIHKEPSDRYQSVRDLARDIESHLTHRPVVAMPDSPGYRLRKWVRRNRVRVILTTTLVVAASTFAFFSWKKQRDMEREKARAQSTFMVQAARWRAASDDPVGASRALWREHLASPRLDTKFGLLELFLRYPCMRSLPVKGLLDVAYSPSGRWLIASTADGMLLVFDAETGEEVQRISAGSEPILCITFSHDGSQLFTGGKATTVGSTLSDGGSENAVLVWPFKDDPEGTTRHGDPLTSPPQRLTIPSGHVYSLALSPDGNTLAAGTGTLTHRGRRTCRGTGTCFLWSLADDAQPTEPKSVATFEGHVTGLAFSSNGRLLAMGTSPPGAHPAALRVMDTKAGDTFYEMTRPNDTFRSLAFDPSDRHLLIGGKHVFRLNLDTKALDQVETTSGSGVRCLALTGHGGAHQLAWASGDGRIRILDPKSGRTSHMEGYHDVQSGRIRLATCPRRGTIASAAPDGLKIWRFTPTRRVSLDRNAVSPKARVRLCQNGQALAIPHEAKPDESAFSLWRWEAQSTPLHAIVQIPTLSPALVMGVAPSADGQWLAAIGGTSAGERTSNVIVGKMEATGFSQVSSLCLEPDNRFLHTHWIEGDPAILLLTCRGGELQAWCPTDPPATETDSPEIIASMEHEECSYACADPSGEWVAACWQGTNRPGRVTLWRRSAANTPRTKTGFFSRFVQAAEPFDTHPFTWRVALVGGPPSATAPIVATSGESANITLWNPQTGSPLAELRGHRRSIDFLLAVDDRLLISSSRDGTVRLWDAWEQEELCILHERDETAPEGVVAPISASGTCVAINTATTVKIIDLSEIDEIIRQNLEYHTQALEQEE